MSKLREKHLEMVFTDIWVKLEDAEDISMPKDLKEIKKDLEINNSIKGGVSFGSLNVNLSQSEIRMRQEILDNYKDSLKDLFEKVKSFKNNNNVNLEERIVLLESLSEVLKTNKDGLQKKNSLKTATAEINFKLDKISNNNGLKLKTNKI